MKPDSFEHIIQAFNCANPRFVSMSTSICMKNIADRLKDHIGFSHWCMLERMHHGLTCYVSASTTENAQ